MSKYITITVRLTKEQKKWLDSRGEINVSGLIRQLLEDLIHQNER